MFNQIIMLFSNKINLKDKKILYIEHKNVRTMFNSAKNNIIKQVEPAIPYYHTRENVITYLKDVCHLTDSLHSSASVLEEICEYDKRSSIEYLAKQRIFLDICGNKKLPIKTIYRNMVKYGNIEDNINFHLNMNSYHGLPMTFYELKTLSKFATTHNAKVYFYQNGEDRDKFAINDTRQDDPDAYFIMYFSDTKLTIIKKGIDIKLGKLKDYGSSYLHPIFIKENENKEVFNNLDIDMYFVKKINTLTRLLMTIKDDAVRMEFTRLTYILQNATLTEKFSALNHFNTLITVNFPNISYKAEFSQIFDFFQPEKPIIYSSVDSFIDTLYLPNANTNEAGQARLANFIKELGSSQIEELFVNSKNRGKRNSDFLKILENKFDNPTKHL